LENQERKIKGLGPDVSTADGSAKVYSSGARRSEQMPRYDLIPTTGLDRLARRYAEGAEKYGEYNWMKGLPIEDTINHVIQHLLTWKNAVVWAKNNIPAGLPKDQICDFIQSRSRALLIDGDELAAAAWGIFTLMHYDSEGLYKWMSEERSNSTTSPSTSASAQSQARDTTR
jgi:hypothetical protein